MPRGTLLRYVTPTVQNHISHQFQRICRTLWMHSHTAAFARNYEAACCTGQRIAFSWTCSHQVLLYLHITHLNQGCLVNRLRLMMKRKKSPGVLLLIVYRWSRNHMLMRLRFLMCWADLQTYIHGFLICIIFIICFIMCILLHTW